MTNVSSSKIHAVVPAGGSGQRALSPGQAGPKQYRVISGQPMIAWAVQALLADDRVADVVVGVQSDDVVASTLFTTQPRVRVVQSAGPTRAMTVLNTLNASGFAADDWVLVHDAARPGLPAHCLTELIDACLANERGGLLALPAADTVKRSGTGSPVSVETTLRREQIWLAQTPQMFRVGELCEALEKGLADQLPITDEASAMEGVGQQPLLVTGSVRNNKVTWAEDFEWIERWL